MKITESKVTVTRIELEPGDCAYDLYENIGFIPGDASVSFVDGALEFRDKE